jgi:hypothetical protein
LILEVGPPPRVLLRDVEEAGVGGREQLDLDGDGLGHGATSCDERGYDPIARKHVEFKETKIK